MKFLSRRLIKFLIIAGIASQATVNLMAQETLVPFSSNGKIGYKDKEGRILVEPRFDYIEEFSEGNPWTVVGTGHYELLNKNMDKREVNFYGKFGLISEEGKMIADPVYTIILKIKPGYAIVGNGNGYLHFEAFPAEKNYVFDGVMGVIGIHGDTIVPVRYTYLQPLTAGENTCWFAKIDRKCFFYGTGLTPVDPGEIETISDFSEGLARVKSSNGYGFMDTTGHIIVEPRFEKASDFSSGQAVVKKNGKYFVLYKTGELEEVKKVEFDEISPVSEGKARVRIFDEYGYVLPDSTFFIRPEFTDAGNFFNGIAPVATADSFGYIHADGFRDMVRKYNDDPVSTWNSGESGLDIGILNGSVSCDCQDSSYFDISIDSLNLSNFSSIVLETIRWGPYLYYRYPQMLERVAAGEGLLAGRFDFDFEFLRPGNQIWEKFRENRLFPLIGNPEFYPVVWNWISPRLKRVFLSMPEKHRITYLSLTGYLRKYFSDYSQEAVRKFLEEHPDEFAYRHWDGTLSPFRKVSAMFERLMYIHQVLDLEDLQDWTGRIDTTLRSWESGY